MKDEQQARQEMSFMSFGKSRNSSINQFNQDDGRSTANEKVSTQNSTVPSNIIGLLKKTSFERTQDDSKLLFRYMREIKAFKDLSDFILSEVCGVLKFQIFDAESAVFRQGEIGTAWYIILSGSCKVLITKTGRVEDSIHVATMHAGSGFGDLALVNDKPRTATIVTAQACQMVIVEKADYNRILKVFHQTEQTEKLLFLRKVSVCASIPELQLKPLAMLLRWQNFMPNQVILEEGNGFYLGTAVKNFCLIRKGECIMYRKLVLEDKSEVRIKVKTLKEFDYFGQVGVLADDPNLVI